MTKYSQLAIYIKKNTPFAGVLVIKISIYFIKKDRKFNLQPGSHGNNPLDP